MKFIKDLNNYSISTENGCRVDVLDENFEYSISEYILCKVNSKSKIGYDLLILYSSTGDPIHCFNKPSDDAYDISKYKIVFTESGNKWFNVRIGITGHLESSKGYSSYQEALNNRLPSDEYTILLEDKYQGPSLSELMNNEKVTGTFDESLIKEMNDLRKDIAWNTSFRYTNKLDSNIKVIDSSGNDVTERFNKFKKLWNKVTEFDTKLLSIVFDIHKTIKLNEYDKFITSDLMNNSGSWGDVIDLYELGKYDLDLDYRYPEKRKLLYLSFLAKYPSLEKYLDDSDSLMREYVILVYGGEDGKE